MTLQDRLREWRGRNGLTQAAAAEVLRVSLRTLQEWEQGRMSPNTLGVEALVARMGEREAEQTGTVIVGS